MLHKINFFNIINKNPHNLACLCTYSEAREPGMKSLLAGERIEGETVALKWNAVVWQNIEKEDFAATFCAWQKCHLKCIRLNGGYVEKSCSAHCQIS